MGQCLGKPRLKDFWTKANYQVMRVLGKFRWANGSPSNGLRFLTPGKFWGSWGYRNFYGQMA